MLKTQPDTVEHNDQIIHDAPGLRRHPGGERRIIVFRVGRHLSGQEYPSVHFHRMRDFATGEGAIM